MEDGFRSVNVRARSQIFAQIGCEKQRTCYYAAPVRNPLYNESSWCVPPSSEEKRKRHGRKERTEERKRRDVGRARTQLLLHEGLLPPSFSGVFRSRSSSGAEKEGGDRAHEKGGPRRGHVSRPGHLPLKRTHCYVPIISFTLAASHLPFSPFVFFLLLPARLLLRYLLALRLLVFRNKQLPFSFAYKSATYLRTCPSRRTTVNRSRGDHRDVLPGDRREKKERGSFAAEAVQPKETQRSSKNCGQDFEPTIVSLYNTTEELYVLLPLENLLINEKFNFAI